MVIYLGDEKKYNYKMSGVDIEAGEEAVKLIKKLTKKTYSPDVLSDIGDFAGLFSFAQEKYEKPVLVSSVDGVGTKLKIAQLLDFHSTVGIDLVAMSVNDLITSGAKPLFFLDYISMGRQIPERTTQIVEGIVNGCQQAGCSLIGGEMAEHPGVMDENDYDLAGFSVGVVEKSKIIDGKEIEKDDVLIGISSSGLHSNGFSLVRKIFLSEDNKILNNYINEIDNTLGDELLKPTKIYYQIVSKLINKVKIKGLVNITGGGLPGNIYRILPEGTASKIDRNSWKIPPIFSYIQKKGQVSNDDMFSTLNMGIGMVAIVSRKDSGAAKNIISSLGEEAFLIGKVTLGQREVFIG